MTQPLLCCMYFIQLRFKHIIVLNFWMVKSYGIGHLFKFFVKTNQYWRKNFYESLYKNVYHIYMQFFYFLHFYSYNGTSESCCHICYIL